MDTRRGPTGYLADLSPHRVDDGGATDVSCED
jgi:hypothetical protein